MTVQFVDVDPRNTRVLLESEQMHEGQRFGFGRLISFSDPGAVLPCTGQPEFDADPPDRRRGGFQASLVQALDTQFRVDPAGRAAQQGIGIRSIHAKAS